VSQATADDIRQWLTHPLTKAVLTRLELDSEELRDQWVLGNFSNEEQHKAQGQAMYIIGLASDIRTIAQAKEEDGESYGL